MLLCLFYNSSNAHTLFWSFHAERWTYHPPSRESFPFSCPNSTCPFKYNFIHQVLLLVVSEPHLKKILWALHLLSLIVKSHCETPRSEYSDWFFHILAPPTPQHRSQWGGHFRKYWWSKCCLKEKCLWEAEAQLEELTKNFDGPPGEEQAAQSPVLDPVEGLLLSVPLCPDSGVGFRKMEENPESGRSKYVKDTTELCCLR